MDIKIHPTRRFGPFPLPTFEDKSTYVESETKVYDRLAFRYLSWLLFPLLGGYAVYSLFYVEHKGKLLKIQHKIINKILKEFVPKNT